VIQHATARLWWQPVHCLELTKGYSIHIAPVALVDEATGLECRRLIAQLIALQKSCIKTHHFNKDETLD